MRHLLPVLALAACAEPLGTDVRSPNGTIPVDPTVPEVTDPGTDPTSADPDPTGGTDPTGVTPEAPDCPLGVICVDALPFVDTNTTTGAASTLDGYSCAPDADESGPEMVYRVTLAEDGLLAASL